LKPKREGESELYGSVVEECMKGKVVGEMSDALFTGKGKGERERESPRIRRLRPPVISK
jgi:hypothetical protein